ncbi:OmpH family outer membrane protein [Verrucomicrobiaceae bacterium R5-34]|uniref:OmpH family outer membrane protein n=1 Tax=Oceaniferula flava TaxID=2800421 RepID=A0AAE2VDB9_9BACT|nr:OmpH family outer membrane protein [Oceaniferula flavus]MBK1830622.1 OmpH family outer membrane protein [Verrucomicrobiaceae bacterium R5-34]MBK1856575.1 OmpH family outer membrane protein [Oceaniferula flavus]MBM1137882.1 OmpH family outer membrane protein [Oceaniferula flavus]
MKKYLKFSAMFCALAIVTAVGTGSAQAQKLKIATVDMQKLFKEYHRTTDEQQKFSEEFAKIQKENNERLAGIRALEEQLQGLKKKIEDPTLSDKLKRDKSREFQLKLDEAKAMDRERREFLGRRTRALELKKQASMKGILEEIRQRIVDHSKKEDFDFVLDKSGLSANQVPFLLYTKDATDITASLLTELNKDAPKAAEKPAEAAE